MLELSAALASAPPDYRAAIEGAALYDEAASGRFFMRGRDRATLLHRLSTNDITRLTTGQGARTVLTTPIGRIIDLLIVHALDDALLVVTSPDQGPPVFGHIRKNTFFNDQVTLEAAGRSYGQLALYGPAAPEILARRSGVGRDDLPPHHIEPIAIAGVEGLVTRREPIGGQGFTLYIPAEGIAAVRAALLDDGATPLSDETYNILRVEQGYSAFGRELSQEYIPLETGLADAISFTKGCYVGQEIIARMESRHRLAKQLRGLKLGASNLENHMPASDGEHALQLPVKLVVEGKDAGDLTSLVVSPRFGTIGLAYVRSAHAAAGAIVGIMGSDMRGEVTELPFGE